MAKQAQLNEVRPMLNEVNNGIGAVEGVLDSIESGADKATSTIEHGLEKVADVVPDALDKGVHVVAEGTRKGVRALQSPRKLAVLLVVGGAVVGAGAGVAGYFLLKKKLEHKLRLEMEAELTEQIDGMRLFYERRQAKKQPFATPEEAAEKLLPKSREEALVDDAVNALNEYEGTEPPPGIIPPENDPREGQNHRVRYDKVPRKKGPTVPASDKQIEDSVEEITHNVFVQRSPEHWDQAAEEANRHPESPYVISHDEYMGSELDDQRSLTYYARDEFLVDEREVPIDEVEATVGMENLKRFGHGSRDSNIVYVRNERIEVDFEIVYRDSSYAEDVAGFQHSDLPTSRFRKGRRGEDG